MCFFKKQIIVADYTDFFCNSNHWKDIHMKYAISIIIVGLIISCVFWYLFRPLTEHPQPAALVTMGVKDGIFQPFPKTIGNIYGIGLSYAKHIEETASEYDRTSDPVVFEKNIKSLKIQGGITPVPGISDLLAAADEIEPGLQKLIQEKFPQLPILLDYEAELGLILLEDIDQDKLETKGYAPKLGFFILNDIGSRSMAVLGEGRDNRYDYWGVSKSFIGFLPVSEKIWVPTKHLADAIPGIVIETRLNGELRQHHNTSDMIYTPMTMLRAIKNKYQTRTLKKGDIVLMGTSGGVALEAPRWKARMAKLLHLSRFTKLKFILRNDQSKFMKPGDTVVVNGEWFGTVTTNLK
jgi:2-keto-4-pentenoate hydratase/2-oxohepta-3-ene-1,7-dioic acid hydratase in catechol pathway